MTFALIGLSAASLAALVVVALAYARSVSTLTRQAGRERDLLLNQLLHVLDRPWTPAPAVRERWAASAPVVATANDVDELVLIDDGDQLLSV